MKFDTPIRQQIDACRPGSDDLALSELAELAGAVKQDAKIAAELDRSQKFDEQVRAALNEVTIPTGLSERLLAAVAAAESEPVGLPVRPTAETASPAHVGRLSRRTWLSGAAAVAATALLALGGSLLWPRGQLLVGQQEIASSVPLWEAAAVKGKGLTTLPSEFRLPAIAAKPVAMHKFRTAEGWSAVGVNYSSPNGGSATLLIVKSPARFSVPTSPYARLAYSAKAIAAWQRGDLLYVLVVAEGPGQRLEDFIRPGSIT